MLLITMTAINRPITVSVSMVRRLSRSGILSFGREVRCDFDHVSWRCSVAFCLSSGEEIRFVETCMELITEPNDAYWD